MNVGTVNLCIKNERGRFIASQAYCDGAFKLGKAQFLEGVPLYYLIHVGGGYVSGDRYEQVITCEEAASLYLTTQAATKVYKGLQPAFVETTIQIKENAHLSLIQDPLILFENAKFHQQITVSLNTGSTFAYTEILTPGWSPTNTPFQYTEYVTNFQLKMNEKLLYMDRLVLQKGMQQTFLQFNQYSHYGTYLCIDSLDEDFYEWLEGYKYQYEQMGISAIDEHGFVCKMLAHRTQHIEEAFQQLDEKIRSVKNRPRLLIRK